jgi:hypothetical protein
MQFVSARRLLMPRWLVAVCLAVALTSVAACGVKYSLRGIATVPFGWRVMDGTMSFGQQFCATLSHLDASHTEWGACDQYIEGQPSQQPPAQTNISRDWRVLVVGGIFSQCFERHEVNAFEQGLKHLEDEHHMQTTLLRVGGVTTPEENGKTIAAYLKAHPGKYIAVGHSKGAVDLMAALQNEKDARDNIQALVSVAGAIRGSRLIDVGTRLTIEGFKQALRDSGLGECEITEMGGVANMRREARHEFLRRWSPPPALRCYSVVGVVDKKQTSKPLRLGWSVQSQYSRDQDSQMIAEEAIIPGATFLAYAKGDHWAVALPFYEHPNRKFRKKVDRNRFPRTALLEAIVRFVDTGWGGHSPCAAAST